MAKATSFDPDVQTVSDRIKEMVGKFKMPDIDAQAMVEQQRKNIDAAVEAIRVANKGTQTVAERQLELIHTTSTHVFCLFTDQLKTIVWKTKILGVNAQTLANQRGKNIAGAATIWTIVNRGACRVAKHQAKAYGAASLHFLSLLAALSMSLRERAKLASEAAGLTLAEPRGICEITASAGERAFDIARQRTIEGVLQIRKHIEHEDLY